MAEKKKMRIELRMRDFLLIALSLIGFACAQHPSRVSNNNSTTRVRVLDVATIQRADPVADLHRSLDQGDKRFVGVEEFGELIPGVENRSDVTHRFGVKYVSGTSCTANKSLQDAACEYAEIYNLLLLRHLRSAGEVQ